MYGEISVKLTLSGPDTAVMGVTQKHYGPLFFFQPEKWHTDRDRSPFSVVIIAFQNVEIATAASAPANGIVAFRSKVRPVKFISGRTPRRRAKSASVK